MDSDCRDASYRVGGASVSTVLSSNSRYNHLYARTHTHPRRALVMLDARLDFALFLLSGLVGTAVLALSGWKRRGSPRFPLPPAQGPSLSSVTCLTCPPTTW
ncbi:hypothetical protein BD310DRAFT_367914 [Dichomitus squalens]|uniref:Uncharacterized protein n=1 Tax=Dichomitus squalens TaxID=114155 RepID=A0A4Q9PDF0_9APHY|nr:hypothetical protein BD310DRAFT_367914 [Dichomitus squalens]